MVDKEFEKFIEVSFDDIDNSKFDPDYKGEDIQWIRKVIEIDSKREETYIQVKKEIKNIQSGRIRHLSPVRIDLGKDTTTIIKRANLRYVYFGQNNSLFKFENPDTVVCRIRNVPNGYIGRSLVCWDYSVEHEENDSSMALFYWDNVENSPKKKSAILNKYLNENSKNELCMILKGVDKMTKLSLNMLGKDYDKMCGF